MRSRRSFTVSSIGLQIWLGHAAYLFHQIKLENIAVDQDCLLALPKVGHRRCRFWSLADISATSARHPVYPRKRTCGIRTRSLAEPGQACDITRSLFPKSFAASPIGVRHDKTFEGPYSRRTASKDAASAVYLITHDVPCEQFTFQETKPPRSPLGPI